MESVLALILAGGKGSRLSILSEERAKPALPFAGKYRFIDFTLTNCALSGIDQLGVLVQHRPESLHTYIHTGRPWELDRGSLTFLYPPRRGEIGLRYEGTADAVYKNLAFLEASGAEAVLILAGDHIYQMDYSQMLRQHRESGADVTVGVAPVPEWEVHRYGILEVDRRGWVLDFQEKPRRTRSRLASMGIYAFSSSVLQQVLLWDTSMKDSSHDFGRDILPFMVGKYRVGTFPYQGFWRDVGTIQAYWETNMEVFTNPQLSSLFYGERRVRTRHEDYPPAVTGPEAEVRESILCNGCRISGAVVHSILSRGVVVEEGAHVSNSVLMENALVRQGARLDKVIVDQGAEVGEGAVVGWGEDLTPNLDEPEVLQSGITLVGTRARVPPSARLGRNCKVSPGADAEDFPPDGTVPSGGSVERHRRVPQEAPV